MTEAELRSHPRYVAEPPIEGSFENVTISLINLSVRGALIRHAVPIDGLTQGTLRLSAGNTALGAEILWTRIAIAGRGNEYESGIRFIQWIELAQGVIDRLAGSRAIHLDVSRPPSMHRGDVV